MSGGRTAGGLGSCLLHGFSDSCDGNWYYLRRLLKAEQMTGQSWVLGLIRCSIGCSAIAVSAVPGEFWQPLHGLIGRSNGGSIEGRCLRVPGPIGRGIIIDGNLDASSEFERARDW